MNVLSIRTTVWCCLAGVAVSLGATAADSLSGNELKAAFSGNTIYITHSNGNKQIAYYRTDGTGKVVGSTTKDFTWEIKGNTICHDTSSKWKCYRVTKVGDGYDVVSEDFQWTPRYVIKIGNTEKY